MSIRKTPPKFSVGDAVRVKRGVADPNFDDIPIGGWAGRITEMQYLNPPMYLIRWDQHTLNNIHPIYRNRCERDGFDIEEMWLAENDLEPGTGDPVPIEQPTRIVTKPLDMDDQDDRIRSVFSLTSDDLLPESGEESLALVVSLRRGPFCWLRSSPKSGTAEWRRGQSSIRLADASQGEIGDLRPYQAVTILIRNGTLPTSHAGNKFPIRLFSRIAAMNSAGAQNEKPCQSTRAGRDI